MTETGSEVARVIQSREELPTDANKAILGLIGERGGHGPKPGPASEHLPLLYHLQPHGTQGTARIRTKRDSRVSRSRTGRGRMTRCHVSCITSNR